MYSLRKVKKIYDEEGEVRRGLVVIEKKVSVKNM
jgi:hypothetical protein